MQYVAAEKRDADVLEWAEAARDRALMGIQDEIVTVKFYPNRNKTPYILTQGTLGVVRSFPVAAQNQATCTISAENGSVSFES